MIFEVIVGCDNVKGLMLGPYWWINVIKNEIKYGFQCDEDEECVNVEVLKILWVIMLVIKGVW